MPRQTGDIVQLNVPDFAQALDFFTRQLGFRVDMIVPADAPRAAVITGQGVTLRLATGTPQAQPPLDLAPEFIISRADDNAAWHAGRAGMHYRDLLPGRLGGRLVASHIRIPAGGPVPDYVHYHKVRLQMIYCRAGWARVVYEDQGPPFVLAAGDCVLQPPEIRHRVLEAAPGLEVIELGCPAVHETWADHELALPTPQVNPTRDFSGQRFVWHRAAAAQWQPWRWPGCSTRDTGLAAATAGLASVRVVRAEADTVTARQTHAHECVWLFVLQGALALAPGEQVLQAGDSCLIPAGLAYALRLRAGLEWLEASLSQKLLSAGGAYSGFRCVRPLRCRAGS